MDLNPYEPPQSIERSSPPAMPAGRQLHRLALLFNGVSFGLFFCYRLFDARVADELNIAGLLTGACGMACGLMASFSGDATAWFWATIGLILMLMHPMLMTA